MEDQKLLWIIFSVVLFAVVVLASVLYFLRPKPAEPAMAVAASGLSRPGEFDTYEYVRGTSPILPMESRESATPGLQIVVGEEPSGAAEAPKTPSPLAASEPRPADQPKPASRTPVPAAAAPARAEPAPDRAAPKSAAQPVVKPAPVQPSRVYWIQTASFKNRSGAESMVGTLGDKGITGRVQVSDVRGQAFYRVRVGPYTNRDEAEKFLAWIRSVEGLEQSYISVVSRPTD